MTITDSGGAQLATGSRPTATVHVNAAGDEKDLGDGCRVLIVSLLGVIAFFHTL